MDIKSLGKTDFDTVFKAFVQAFSDYEIQLDKMQLQTMLIRRGCDPELSFAAFDGDVMVAFTLNGIGNFNGIYTAYDTGTGTLKDYRGKGLATQIFEYSIPFLKENGIKQYLLEVLQHNTKAVSVYSKLGFNTTREFNYFRQKNEDIKNETSTPYFLSIIPINIDQYDCIPAFWDFAPSWQNSFESIRRASKDFISLGAFIEEKLVGYCIFEPTSGDITQLAVERQHRRKGIASSLLQEMTNQNKHDSIKVVNTDISCSSITAFLESKNITLTGKQFEMIKKI